MKNIRKTYTVMTKIGIVSSLLVMASCQTSSMETDRSPSSSNTVVGKERQATRKESDYADGNYTATGYYGSLPSSITVEISLVDAVIKEVKVTPHATNPTSLDLQRRFAKAVPAVVVGKQIDEVKVDRLAGSSGTPNGFNDAIEQIKEQAKI